MNKIYRIGVLVRNVAQVSFHRLASFSSRSAMANPRFSNSSTDGNGGSGVYRYVIENQRPASVTWSPLLANSVSLIGYVDRPLKVYGTRGDTFGAYTVLTSGKSDCSNHKFRILVEMWGHVARTCVEHLKVDDHIYVSGALCSYMNGDEENLRLSHKIVVKELNFVARNNHGSICRKSSGRSESLEESRSQICQIFDQVHATEDEIGIERYKKHLYLWQVYFTNPHEWWDNRKSKKSQRQPDFKHKATGEALWLHPNDPPWVNKQLQLLDSRMAEQSLVKDQGSCNLVSQWLYDE